MRSSGKIMHGGLGSAVHSVPSACKLLHYSAALMGDRAWGAAEEVSVCRSMHRMIPIREVCRTGRRLEHSEAAGRKKMMEKPGRRMGH